LNKAFFHVERLGLWVIFRVEVKCDFQQGGNFLRYRELCVEPGLVLDVRKTLFRSG
jgi:hypothetical protein